MKFTEKDKKFKKLYDSYYPLVFNLVYSKLNNREETEDICQVVFMEFYNKLDSIDSHMAWLKTVTRYSLSNFFQKKDNQIKKIELEDAINSPELIFVNGARDIRIILNEAFEDMSNFENEKEKVIFDLITLNNYTYKEAALLLNLTLRQVQYLYRKALNHILDYLKKKGISELEDIL